MSPDEGKEYLRVSRIGIAQAKGSGAWHIFRAKAGDEGIDFTPGQTRFRGLETWCGGYSVDGSPADVPGYVPVSLEGGIDDAVRAALPADERLCPQCEMNFVRSRKTPPVAKKGAAARASAEVVTAAVHKVRKHPGNPAIWRVTFRNIVTEAEYVASTPQLRDHDKFATWWLQTFHSALVLSNEAWATVLDKIGEKTKVDEAGDMSEDELLHEAALSFLSRYRIVSGIKAMGVGYARTVFQRDGKVWLVCGELITELRRQNFDVDASQIRAVLPGVILAVGKQFEMHGVNRRCWPIDVKKAGIPEEVLVLEDNELLVTPDPGVAAQKTLGEGDSGL